MAKRKPKKKIPVKKTSLAVVSQSETGAIKGKTGSLTMQSTWLKKNQLLQVLQRTPEQHVRTRKGKGGQDWDYVTGVYVTKVLNYVFGWNWDFEIIKQEIVADQVVTTGKLTVRSPKGDTIIKNQVGRSDIKIMKDGKKYLDIGNDYKASATDALKKCASMLGIASDIYGKEEFKEIGVAIKHEPTRTITPKDQRIDLKKEVDFLPEYECENCLTPVTKEEAHYSKTFFKGHIYCRNCQKLSKQGSI